MFMAASLSILAIMALALLRACRGPTIFDRILAVNIFGTKTVLLVAVLAVVAGNASFLDIALVYALINFISILAVPHFFEQSRRARGEAGG